MSFQDFAKNCSKASKLFGDRLAGQEETTFQRKALTRIIEEKFRKIRYLRSRCASLQWKVQRTMTSSRSFWVKEHSRRMAACVTEDKSRQLRRKVEALRSEKEQRAAKNSDRKSQATSRRVFIEEAARREVPGKVPRVIELGRKFIPRVE